MSDTIILDVSRFRDFVQTLYRRLGFLQRDVICCANVTVPQCYALQILLSEREMTPGDLADRLGLDPSSATRAADVLVKRGLIERSRPEEGDRRRVLLRLTREGTKLTEVLLAAGDQFYGGVLAQFSKKDRKELFRLLEKLAGALQQTTGCCDPFGLADGEKNVEN